MTTQRSSKIAPFYQVYAGINARDLDQAVAGYAPDVHYVERCLGWDLHSRQEVKEHFGPWFEYADLSVEMEDSFDSGDRSAVSWRFSGKVLNEPLARAGITMLVNAEEDIAIVAEAADGQDALTQVRAQRPDVVLMDVRMPGTDGVEATRAVIDEGLTAQNGRPIGVIILTTFHIDEAVYAALRAGAKGFLLKDAAPTEIVAAIRAVAAGEAWLAPAVTSRLIDEFITRPEQNKSTPVQMAQLTLREREVLILLAQGMSNADVARKLFISEATVKTYLAHVMTKLGVREKAHAVIAAYQTGLVRPRSSD